MKSLVFFFASATIYAFSLCCSFHEYGVLSVVLSVIATVLAGVGAMIASSFEDRFEKLEKEIKELRKRKE